MRQLHVSALQSPVCSDCICKIDAALCAKRHLTRNIWYKIVIKLRVPPHGKTSNLHRRKQRRRPAFATRIVERYK